MAKKKPESTTTENKNRARISQTDVPHYSIDEALEIPRAIVDNYAGKPTKPLRIASALKISPGSSNFRYKCGASIAYGLTSGGYNSPEITLEPLGKRILQPLSENEDLVAKREAVLKPTLFRDFFQRYNDSPLPKDNIALNVLQDMGIPRERTESVYELIITNAKSVDFIKEINGKQYIDLASPSINEEEANGLVDSDHIPDSLHSHILENIGNPILNTSSPALNREEDLQLNRRVFISHGKNKTFIDPIKKLIEFGEMTPVVSIEKQSVSLPVPEKVMQDMRSCGAGIIHVDLEKKIVDEDSLEHILINDNVLIEIGAAMALYGRRLILLVKDGIKVPSNLQGLYEVRYKGEFLNSEETIKLLEAIKDIKNHSVPDRKAKTNN